MLGLRHERLVALHEAQALDHLYVFADLPPPGFSALERPLLREK